MVLAAAVLTGCSSKVGGRPIADETFSEPRSAVEVLGELTTIEPCSLTDPEVFAEYGEVDFALPESLDYCSILVKPDASTEVVVTVGQLNRLSDNPDLESQKLEDVNDELYTVQVSPDQSFCAQALVFAEEDLMLEVSTYMLAGESTITCEMVQDGMDRVIEVIESGEVEHRSPVTDSLVTLDPCALIEDATVTALPGFAAAEREDNPGRHQCYWRTSAGDDRLSVRVIFGAGPTPLVTDVAGANANPIAGRPTVTNPFRDAGSSAFCTVETGHIPFTEVEGQPAVVELAQIFVRMPAGQVQAGCQAAVAVATALWPQLPPV